MNVASLELSKKLYELSAWDKTQFSWSPIPKVDNNGVAYHDGKYSLDPTDGVRTFGSSKLVPAYDCGYLLRKLPKQIPFGDDEAPLYMCTSETFDWYMFGYTTPNEPTAKTPEDALCELAIKLFEEGILTKEDNDE